MSSTVAAASATMLLFVAVFAFHSASAFPPCLPCPNGICGTGVSEDTCRYKTTTDYCGRTVCKRGPDEICGGFLNIRGQCGEGLVCSCGRCVGCSFDTMQCAELEVQCNL